MLPMKTDGSGVIELQMKSIQEVIQYLNSNPEACPEGVCSAFSERRKSWFLLWAFEKTREVSEKFQIVDPLTKMDDVVKE